MASTSQAPSPTSGSPAGESTGEDSPVQALLATAVSAIGGSERSGQTVMAQAVWDSVTDGTHLAVQAGTGTGKSLAYLVPAMQLA
ncbi:MAG TPA: ATP-dependent helicase, partial [Trebonia sp.]|nr:ATP-dependent helicase [Trebonia sp.]